MIRDLGIVQPGTTLYIPFHTFDSNDPSASVTLTGLATTDIEIYKDGSVTQRASDNGYALLDTDGIDFDGTTGIHGISIDLADNSTAGFYAAGSQYWVVIASVTVDAAIVNFVLCTFRIGYPSAILNTTIASLSSQTSFTLTAGPAEDDALNGQWAIIHDVASAVQKACVQILDYTGSTKTVTLAAGATFTAAATDNISVMGPMPIQPTTTGRTLDVSSGGEAGLDWANVGSPTTSLALTGTTIAPTQKVDVDTIKTNPVVNGGTLTFPSGATLASTTNITAAAGCAVSSIGNNVITAASINADAITAAKVAADVTTEIQSGLATSAALATAQADLDILTGADGAVIASGTQTFNITGNITGNLSGSVGSVTGNVGGNVTGSVGSMASGGITRASFAADTGLQTVRSNTAQAGAAGTVTLDASASATTDFYAGQRVYLTGGTGAGQDRLITAYNGTSKVATVESNWATNPDNTSTFAIVADGRTDAEAINLSATGANELARCFNGSGGDFQVTSGSIALSAFTVSAGVTFGAFTPNFANNVITAAVIADNAIDAATFAADVDAEILSYLVDDATRIDASALNTASGAIGSNGSGLTEAGGDGDHLTAINLPNQTMDIVGNITGNLSGSVGSVTGAVGSVTGNVGGNVAGSVGSVTGAVGSVTGLTASDVAAIKVIVDALGAAAAARLALSAGSIVTGTVDDTGFSPTTTEFEADDITTAAADHYNGRIIIFTSGTLQYQATSISDYSLSGGRGHFTVPALTSAPANDVTFIIV